jgi:hypothetical protein
VVVVIPWRDRGDPDRLANLDTVLTHLGEICDWPVVVCGDGRDAGPFNRSAAYNRAVRSRPGVDVFTFCEADILLPPGALQTAVDLAQVAPGLVIPFDSYRYLPPDVTAAVRAGAADPFTAKAKREMLGGRATGAVNVVSAAGLAAVGGYDEGFSGWGYDDRAAAVAFRVATRQPTRYVPGPAVHLYHTPGWQVGGRFAGGAAHINDVEAAATAVNRRRYQLYLNATTPARIRDLTAGRD